jgi:putative thioredoxin
LNLVKPKKDILNAKNKPLIFEVSQNNFKDIVIHNSFTLPVLVEFMGIWSEPCIKTEQAIVQLAQEFAGDFIFVKIDIDEQDELKKQFSITNIPTLAVFKNGKEVQREEGELRLEELRILLKHYGIFNQADELRNQARIKHIAGDTQSAIALLTKAILADPSNVRVALDMVQIFLDIGETEQAQELFNKLPKSVEKTDIGLSISTQFNFINLAKNTVGITLLQEQVLKSPDDYQARFDLAVCLFAQHDIKQGMEMLFFVQENNPKFQDEAAKEMIGMICNMLAKNNPEESGVYRRRLANLIETSR